MKLTSCMGHSCAISGQIGQVNQPYVRVFALAICSLFSFMCLTVKGQEVFKSEPVSGQQQAEVIHPLKIGDTIPEALWNMPLQVVNHPEGKKTITLNDYRGKLIIVDFWATWCSSCIVAMPKSHSLQKQLKDTLIILPVTYEDPEKARAFLKSNPTIRGLNLSSVVKDSVLKTLFPYRLIPHYVWIGTDQKVKAFTSAEELRMENVRKMIKNESLKLTVKNDIDITKPLFLTGDLQNNEVIHYAVLTKGYHNGLPGGTRPTQSGKVTYRRTFTNSSILTLYRVTAHQLFQEKGGGFESKRLIIDVAKPEKIDYNPAFSDVDSWNRENVYSYDLVVPLEKADQLYHYLLDDLNRYLNYYGRIEKRKVKYLALSLKDKSKKFPTGDDTSMSLSFLAKKLDGMSFINVPVLDETNYKGEVNFLLPEVADLKQLNEQLAQYNLQLIEGRQPIDMFILSDKKL